MLTVLALLTPVASAADLHAQRLDPERPRIRVDLAPADTATNTVHVVIDTERQITESVAVPRRAFSRFHVDVDGSIAEGVVTIHLADSVQRFVIGSPTAEGSVQRNVEGWFVRTRAVSDGVDVVVGRRGGDVVGLESVEVTFGTKAGAVSHRHTVDVVRQVFSVEPYAELLTDLAHPGRVQVTLLDAEGSSLAVETGLAGGPVDAPQIVRSNIVERRNGSRRLITTTVAAVGVAVETLVTDLNGEELLETEAVEIGRVTTFAAPIVFEPDRLGSVVDFGLSAPGVAFDVQLSVDEDGGVAGFDGEWGNLYLMPGETPEEWFLVVNYTEDLDAPLANLEITGANIVAVLEPVEVWSTTRANIVVSEDGVAMTLEADDGTADGFETEVNLGAVRSASRVGDVEDVLFRMTQGSYPRSGTRNTARRVRRRRY